MDVLNTWSGGHFIMWTFAGRFLLTNWYTFFVLSVCWEVVELGLPFEFANETLENKLSDLVINTMGFRLGLRMRNDP